MNILLNFIPLKQGGGVQVGLDFLSQAKLFGKEHNWYIVATEGTPFVDYEYSENIYLVKIIPNKIISRLVFEYLSCKQVIKKVNPEVIYTQFGPVWPGAKNKVNVAGCAYSYLMYPEINFWGEQSLTRMLKQKTIDYFRTVRMLSSDYIIYETPVLAEKARTIYKLRSERVDFVLPSVSSLVKQGSHHEETLTKLQKMPNGYHILLLSHYRQHKNIEILPKIAKCLKDNYGISKVVFVITLDAKDSATINILRNATELGVIDNIYNIEPINYRGCSELYNACDAVILPSLLESFSNTIAEAWEMKKPLLISDLEWARSICCDVAIYIEYNDACKTAKIISQLIDDKALSSMSIENGTLMLQRLSDSKSRFMKYKKIIEAAVITRTIDK